MNNRKIYGFVQSYWDTLHKTFIDAETSVIYRIVGFQLDIYEYQYVQDDRIIEGVYSDDDIEYSSVLEMLTPTSWAQWDIT